MKKLDEIDQRILGILYQSADITNKELATQIGIAPSTCLERVKRLKSSGVIKGSFIDVNFKSIGGNIEAIAAIKLQPYSEEIVNKFRDDLLQLPEIVSLYHMGGMYDYFIHMSVKDTEHLRSFVLMPLLPEMKSPQWKPLWYLNTAVAALFPILTTKNKQAKKSR